MSRLKNILSTVMHTTTQASEGWRFLRQAVHELHGFVGMIDKALVSFESRLATLESQASGATPRKSRRSPARKHAAA